MKWKLIVFIILYLVLILFRDEVVRHGLTAIMYSVLFMFGLCSIKEEIWVGMQRIIRHRHKMISLLALCVLTYMTAMYLGNLISHTMFNVLNLPYYVRSVDNVLYQSILNSSLPVAVIVLGIFNPVVEEIFFRYILLNHLKKLTKKRKLNKHIAIIGSSLLFALVHVNALQVSEVLNVIPYFAMSLVFGYFYQGTKNLALTMGLHIIHSFYQYVFMMMF